MLQTQWYDLWVHRAGLYTLGLEINRIGSDDCRHSITQDAFTQRVKIVEFPVFESTWLSPCYLITVHE